LREVLRELGRRQVTSVLIEGGGQVLGEAFDRRLVQRVQIYVAPVLCGGPVVVVGGRGVGSNAEAAVIRRARYEKVGTDLRMMGEVEYPGVV